MNKESVSITQKIWKDYPKAKDWVETVKHPELHGFVGSPDSNYLKAIESIQYILLGKEEPHCIDEKSFIDFDVKKDTFADLKLLLNDYFERRGVNRKYSSYLSANKIYKALCYGPSDTKWFNFIELQKNALARSTSYEKYKESFPSDEFDVSFLFSKKADLENFEVLELRKKKKSKVKIIYSCNGKVGSTSIFYDESTTITKPIIYIKYEIIEGYHPGMGTNMVPHIRTKIFCTLPYQKANKTNNEL